jgi:hypothetical protein
MPMGGGGGSAPREPAGGMRRRVTSEVMEPRGGIMPRGGDMPRLPGGPKGGPKGGGPRLQCKQMMQQVPMSGDYFDNQHSHFPCCVPEHFEPVQAGTLGT